MFDDHARPTTVASLAIALLALPLAGCMGADTPSFDSYDEASQADGVELAPYGDGGPDEDHRVRLKTLNPTDPLADSEVGETNLVYLLFDREAGEPITDASISMDVTKTHEDTRSSTVEAPQHQGEGIYEGATSFDKHGGWVVDLEVTLAGGETLSFPLHYHAGETDHTHESYYHVEGDHEHGDGHDHEH